MFSGKIHYFDWAMASSSQTVNVYDRPGTLIPPAFLDIYYDRPANPKRIFGQVPKVKKKGKPPMAKSPIIYFPVRCFYVDHVGYHIGYGPFLAYYMAFYGIFCWQIPRVLCVAPGSDDPWGALRSKRASPPHCLPSRPVQNHPGTAGNGLDMLGKIDQPETMGGLPSNCWGFPVKMFPSSNSMISLIFGSIFGSVFLW